MSSKPVRIPGPDHPITVEPAAARIVVTLAGRTIADSTHALTLREASYPPVHYIPRADVDMAALGRSATTSYCPYKGEASYFSIPAGGDRSVDAIWTYEAPHDAVAVIKDHLAFYPSRVDSIEERLPPPPLPTWMKPSVSGAAMTSIYDFTANGITGEPRSLGDYRGQVMLIVNTASKCGFTPQYEGLEALHKDYAAKGLAVLGFPCNQFGAQEPGDAAEIANFCKLTYDVDFPMFAKIEVNGDGAHPLYRYLKHEARGLFGTERIKWNFTKFLVDRSGKVIRRFAPNARPETLRPAIEALL